MNVDFLFLSGGVKGLMLIISTHYFVGELELKKLLFRDLSSLIYPDNHSVSNKILIRNIEIKLNSYWS